MIGLARGGQGEAIITWQKGGNLCPPAKERQASILPSIVMSISAVLDFSRIETLYTI